MRAWIAALAVVIAVGGSLAAPPARAEEPEAYRWTEPDAETAHLSTAYDFTCAVRVDGSLTCWGGVTSGIWYPPTGTFTAVAAGWVDACAIRVDGTLACWGQGGGLTPPPGTYRAVTVGSGFACAIRQDDRSLVCWGPYGADVLNPPGGAFVALDAGETHACAIREDGTIACWGDNEYGKASPPAGTFTALSAGGLQSCGVTADGTLVCWGWNGSGQLDVPSGEFAAVAAGWAHVCALTTLGTLLCWGLNDSGQADAPEGSFEAASAGDDHTCAVASDGAVTCWGGFGAYPPEPVAAMPPLPVWVADRAISLRWSAQAALAPVASYDVRYRRAPWNGSFGSRVTWKSATTATSATFTGTPGYTYCFSVRARDVHGVTSPWTEEERCTAIPLDDRSLGRSRSWVAGTGSAYYRSTYLRSTVYGAKLTRTGVVADRIALLATTCRTCGTVKVYWGATLVRTVSLYSATTVRRKLISVAAFARPRSGTLTIKVVSSRKPVIVDGLAIRRWTYLVGQ